MTQLVATLAIPAATYFALLAALYGLTFAALNPRARLTGAGGAVALAVALCSLHGLAASYAALGLVALGALLLIAEFHLPFRGVLGLGGFAAFVLGSVMLFDLDGRSRAALAAFAVAGSLVQLRVIHLAMRRRRPPLA